MLGSETAPFARGSDCRGVCDLHRSADHVRPRLSEEDGTSFRCVSAADLYRFTPSQDGFGPVIVEDQDGPSSRDRSSDHWRRVSWGEWGARRGCPSGPGCAVRLGSAWRGAVVPKGGGRGMVASDGVGEGWRSLCRTGSEGRNTNHGLRNCAREGSIGSPD